VGWKCEQDDDRDYEDQYHYEEKEGQSFLLRLFTSVLERGQAQVRRNVRGSPNVP
jgi:hypothetical protein